VPGIEPGTSGSVVWLTIRTIDTLVSTVMNLRVPSGVGNLNS
jgi:hypothetical protein